MPASAILTNARQAARKRVRCGVGRTLPKARTGAISARAYDLSKIANETMGADKFFEEKTWKRLFSQDHTTAAQYEADLAARK